MWKEGVTKSNLCSSNILPRASCAMFLCKVFPVFRVKWKACNTPTSQRKSRLRTETDTKQLIRQVKA